MKKNILTFLCLITVISVSVALFTACGKEPEHEYGELQEEIFATCTKNGVKARYYCPNCQTYFDEDKNETSLVDLITSPLGHEFTHYRSDGNAICEDGTETAVCNHAGCNSTDTRTDVGSGLGHVWKDNHTNQHPCLRTGCNEKIDVLELSEDGTTVTGLTEYGKTVSYIAIPEGVTTIGDEAFEGSTAMQSIEIPTTLTSFGRVAFLGVFVEKVYIKNLENYLNTDAYFVNSPFCHGAELYLNNLLVEDLVIPDGETSINALKGCESIITVTCGSDYTSVGTYAFDGLPNLTTVTLSDTTTFLGTYSFFGYDNLEKIVIKNPSVSFEIYSINECPNLKTIEFNGTIAEWQACVEGAYCPISEVSPDCVIQCTDGTINVCDNELE